MSLTIRCHITTHGIANQQKLLEEKQNEENEFETVLRT